MYENRKRTTAALFAAGSLLAVAGMLIVSGPVEAAKKPQPTPSPTTTTPWVYPSLEPTKPVPTGWPTPEPSIWPQN